MQENDFNQKISQFKVSMRLPVIAKLKTTKQKLRKILGNYPKLVPISYGKEMGYYTTNGEQIFAFYFAENFIVHEIYSSSSPTYFLRESLLRLLGILLFLDGSYEVSAESIFPYMIAELSKSEINSIKAQNISHEIKSYQVLSRRIIGLLDRANDLSSRLENSQSQLRNAIAGLIQNEAQGTTISISGISSKYRLEREIVVDAIANLQNFGYKPLMHDSDRFILVSI